MCRGGKELNLQKKQRQHIVNTMQRSKNWHPHQRGKPCQVRTDDGHDMLANTNKYLGALTPCMWKKMEQAARALQKYLKTMALVPTSIKKN